MSGHGPISLTSEDDLDVPALAFTDAGLWSPERRKLTVGLVLTITLVAFESLAIATVMPVVKDDLGGLGLYGWVFSGFFLASILGIVVAGQMADRRGLALPFAVGLGIFSVGLALGGASQSMEMLVLARVLQGFGAGAIPAVAYASIARGYPPSLRPRMFATTATAWVIPGLIGPAIAALVEQTLSWRWVFLALLPVVLVAALVTVPALARLSGTNHRGPISAATAKSDRQRLRRVSLLCIGVGAMLGAGTGPPVPVAVLLLAVGTPLAVWAFIGLVPKGTLRLAPGVPATVGVRGILTWAFFSADAYVPLALQDGRGTATWVAGAALSASCVTWASGSWGQARLIDRLGPRHLDQIGFAIYAVAVAGMLGVSLGLPVGLAIVAWGLAGLGMGLAYSPLSVTVLAAAPKGEEGAASASIQLSDTLGIALGTGLGGWIIAVGDGRGWSVSSSVAIAFGASLAVTIGGFFASGRLPLKVPTPGSAGS